MQVSNWFIFGAIELLVLLLIICTLLLFYARNLKVLIGKLQDKLKRAVQDLKKSQHQCTQLQDSTTTEKTSYGELVEQQLQVTREYHTSLSPGRDIELDLERDTPIPRRVASLRHAFLNSEMGAAAAIDTTGDPDWEALQLTLGNLITLFTPASTSSEAAAPLADTAAGPIQPAAPAPPQAPAEVEGQERHPGEELARMKTVAANQHRLITELQQRLAVAYSTHQKDAVIKDLNSQLEGQLHYLKESETCIELLESELSQATRLNAQLQEKFDNLARADEQNSELIKTATQLKQENETMQQRLNSLQMENQQLAAQLEMLMSSSSGDADGSSVQQELRQLQQQYLDLENKYLGLRMKSQ